MLKGFIQTGKASVIIDGQYGSTGKGLIAAWATEGGNYPHIATTNAAANAGHTTKYQDGREILCYHLPTIGVRAHQTEAPTQIYLNAGSIIDIGVLMHECARTDISIDDVIIHPRAAIIEAEDKVYEEDTSSAQTRLASTRKGVGRALARKVMREGKVAGQYPELRTGIIDLNKSLGDGASITIEVPQGMSLSINHGLSYPHCTSRDVSVGQALADANVHPSFLGPVMMTCRTMPIRVGNIYNHDGGDAHLMGSSGPCFPDQREISWDDIGIEPELTTVTKRPRRIFTWSNTQYEQALRAARPDVVFLNFVNYLKDGTEFDDLMWRMRAAEAMVGRPTQKIFGYGPNVEDITSDPRVAREKTRNV